jgi:DNA mismatch repair protein MutS2
MATGEIREGDRVRLPGSGAVGLVVEVRDERILVETGGIRISVLARDVSSVAQQGGESSRATAGGGWVGPSVDASSEIDLRGLRVEEVDHELNHALDQAILGDLGELRIIHGKGTGALRERVGEILTADSRIRSFRLGRHGEGGAGITIGFLR